MRWPPHDLVPLTRRDREECSDSDVTQFNVDAFVADEDIEEDETTQEIKTGEVLITDPHTGGQKCSKPERFDLLPWDALEELARVFHYGCGKYEARNWERGYSWSLSTAALGRHFARFMKGQDRDEDSGLLHPAHIAWHALVLVAFSLRGIGTDDRRLYRER